MNERIRRDWYVINKFAEEQGLENGLEQGLEQGLKQGLEQGLEQGKAQGRVDSLIMIVKSRFPNEYSVQSADWHELLASKSISELNELINTSISCASFQDVANRVANRI